jgi:hypothetical protein
MVSTEQYKYPGKNIANLKGNVEASRSYDSLALISCNAYVYTEAGRNHKLTF